MESFVVSARKYRPSTFESVVGQESITSTLKNAIASNQVAQSFLFCGPRGIGKTTCARILAKTINCTDRTVDHEACGKCESCQSFDSGASLNIFELDAASNNSVEDIRQLINQVRIAPTIGTKKVYIVDEVHMLSTAAFNAFLKTLEEPPEHAVFILATTEKHKILPTILSRCQIFNFNRISVEGIVGQLKDIATKEKIECDDEGLHVIAQKSDGGLRDALSIFDQLVSFSKGKLSYTSVAENLNVLDHDYYLKATDHMIKKELSSLFVLLDEVLKSGFEEQMFMLGWAEHFRNLLMAGDPRTESLVEASEGLQQKYKEQASQIGADVLVAALEVISDFDVEYRQSKNKRLLTEVGLMRLCSEDLSSKKKSPVG